ncbi:MAG TPA: MBL fold metallo-hydrolase [Candidatus Limnocylindrales bacterium]|nr:MBL fold metallo-hydrolase [Candidatus Limnocylindrales bacterium]
MDGRTGSLLERGHLTCHCLLIETDEGLVLADTGLGLRDVAAPSARLSSFFLSLVSPDFREEMTAVRQIERMGFDASDVRHILLSHLDFDHAGGLDDFPHATVHMLGAERDYAMAQKTWLDRQRFRPQQWSTQPNWKVYRTGEGESWFGFERVRTLEGLPHEIALVPLVGHTHGHAGIAVDRGDVWLLLAADAYFFYAEMDVGNPRCTPGLRLYQWMMEKQREERLRNQVRLRELCRDHAGRVKVFCSHDVGEFERLAGRPADAPAPPLQPAREPARPHYAMAI